MGDEGKFARLGCTQWHQGILIRQDGFAEEDRRMLPVLIEQVLERSSLLMAIWLPTQEVAISLV